MAAEPEELEHGGWNYFSYYTEVEEHFQRVRGTGLFLLSPIDWTLIETWKNGGVPIEAVLRGIESAFEKWSEKKTRIRQVNSLAYCAQAVHEEAQKMAGLATGQPQARVKPAFEMDDVVRFLSSNADQLRARPEFASIVETLDVFTAEIEKHYADLEQLEQRLSGLEEKMSAIAKLHVSEEDLFLARRELDTALKPYRGKMTADQLSMLERQFIEKRVIEHAKLPRLSLFYLQPDAV